MGIATRTLWAGAVALLAIGAGWSYWFAYHGILATAPFDAARWRAPMSHAGDPVCHRGRMVEDARRTVLVPQALRSDVERRLGPADVVHDTGGRSYHLGRCRGLRTRLDVLYLSFGSGDRLNQVAVLTY